MIKDIKNTNARQFLSIEKKVLFDVKLSSEPKLHKEFPQQHVYKAESLSVFKSRSDRFSGMESFPPSPGAYNLPGIIESCGRFYYNLMILEAEPAEVAEALDPDYYDVVDRLILKSSCSHRMFKSKASRNILKPVDSSAPDAFQPVVINKLSTLSRVALVSVRNKVWTKIQIWTEIQEKTPALGTYNPKSESRVHGGSISYLGRRFLVNHSPEYDVLRFNTQHNDFVNKSYNVRYY